MSKSLSVEIPLDRPRLRKPGVKATKRGPSHHSSLTIVTYCQSPFQLPNARSLPELHLKCQEYFPHFPKYAQLPQYRRKGSHHPRKSTCGCLVRRELAAIGADDNACHADVQIKRKGRTMQFGLLHPACKVRTSLFAGSALVFTITAPFQDNGRHLRCCRFLSHYILIYVLYSGPPGLPGIPPPPPVSESHITSGLFRASVGKAPSPVTAPWKKSEIPGGSFG